MEQNHYKSATTNKALIGLLLDVSVVTN